ncbi:hypothetical protein Nepgr_009573 [Nepenthes gracilis]|uniref:C2 domain-containing protein n=1 Tax=Nepenthes gracilis TaxID=150966 RepID=A0AAD3SAR4_NEPGR|nr:hypothetical protein Nepgr_009573 [Nepenthes gracilis]
MEFRPVDVKVISASGLKNVNAFTKMDVYVIGSVTSDPRSIQRTSVDKDGGTNPKWNYELKFTVDEAAAQQNHISLLFQIMSDRALGDKEIGRVYVALKDLFDRLQTTSGKLKGTLLLSFKLGEKFTQKIEEPPAAIAYPTAVVGVSSYNGYGDSSGAKMAYPPPSASAPATAVPYPAPVGYPQAPHGYPYGQPAGYPPAQWYGHPAAPPPPYGYYQPGYGQVPMQPPPKKGSKFGMGTAAGIGAGLLGGLLLGEMVDDVADAAVDDAMYDF